MNTASIANRLRRAADRHGLRLVKNPRRNPDAFDYGLYALIDVQHGGTIHAGSAIGTPYALDLEDVEECLREIAAESAS